MCVATSALRDAPNAQEFVSFIKQELKLNIKIIDGKEEAKLGAIAAKNLLPLQDGVTIDIGGGSSDMALIKDGAIIDTYSLNIGTVRIKELFFDKNNISKDEKVKKATIYIKEELNRLPSSFKSPIAIGIGGTARTLSKAIMQKDFHPLDKLHAFTYEIEKNIEFFHNITTSSAKNLHKYYINEGRYDTIREGTLIFIEILSKIEAQSVITSSVGVREGIFLKDLLRNSNYNFPSTLNPSIKSILDRFDNITSNDSQASHRIKLAKSLYKICHVNFGLEKSYQNQLNYALKLSNIGKTLTIYSSHHHAFYISMQELNYGFTHKEMILISILLRTRSSSLIKKSLYDEYASLLPPKEKLKCLSFIYNLTILIHENTNNADIKFEYKNQILTIKSSQSLYHAKEGIKALKKPHSFAIKYED